MIEETIFVDDLMQSRYQYILLEPPGKNFDASFLPELEPAELLELGVFGGRYMRDCKSEFPDSWFTNARFSSGKSDPSINCFGVNASQSLSEWKRKGWIYEHDPRGWFQWYCRYFQGRRCPDDARQIKRWRAMRRHVSQLTAHCPPCEHDCRPRQRQALLHWAYDSRRM